MSKHRVAVLKVVSAKLSVTAAAVESGISRGHLHRLLRRYREDCLAAVEPRSRRPRTSPGRAPDAVRDRIIALRIELTVVRSSPPAVANTASTSKSPSGGLVFVARSVESSRMSEECARSRERQAPRPRGSGRASLMRRSRTAAGSLVAGSCICTYI